MSDVQSASPVREGDIIAGKYRVEKVLGVGGMGVVVAAMHIDLEQRVALKFLLAEATSHPEVAARFAREAKAAARIQSEHVAKVLDVSTLPNGSPYMVMEFMDGEDLEHVLARVGPMPVQMAVSYVLQACEALAEAHAVGIVHRDLKPSNLFLARRPSGEPIVKVLDFGISKSTMTSSQASLTRTSSILGSPLYMSPEQMASAKSVDTRSDIWALGVVLYELLGQRAPFPAETMPELVAAVLQSQPDAIFTLRPDLPPAFAAAVHRCLEKDPRNRFQNVAELAGAIAPYGPPRSDVSVERISHVLQTNKNIPGVTGMSEITVQRQAFGQTGNQPIPLVQGSSGAVGGKTNAQWSGSISEDKPATGSGAKTALLIAIPLLLAAAATVGMFSFFRGQAAIPVAAAPALATAPAAPSADPAPSASPSAAPATPSTGAASAAPASPPASSPPPAVVAAAPPPPSTHNSPALVTPPPQVAPPPPSAVAAPPEPPVAKPAAPAGPVCKMVSYFDAEGNKRFKKECK